MTELTNRDQLLLVFEKRERQCRMESRAYQLWLDRITPLKWISVGGGTVLSALAGATVLAQPVLFGSYWSVIGGVLALVSSILTGLHTALKCDAHQAECHRLIQLFASMEAAAQSAPALSAAELPVAWKELESRFQEAIAKATASPPAWCRRKVESEMAHTQHSAAGDIPQALHP